MNNRVDVLKYRLENKILDTMDIKIGHNISVRYGVLCGTIRSVKTIAPFVKRDIGIF